MKKTAVEWLIGRFHYEGFIGTYCSEEQIKSKRQIMIEIIEQAKEIEKNQSYSYDEIRTIAYNAYCLAQLDEPTEGKYNLWIQQYKKNSQTN
jgi:hypothetical protein